LPFAKAALLLLLSAPLVAPAETAFRVETRDGPIALEVHDDGATLQLRLPRHVALDVSTRALDELLTQAFPQHVLPAERISIDVGRIIEHPWLSQRLAEAALRSPRDSGAASRAAERQRRRAQRLTTKLVAPWAAVLPGATVQRVEREVLIGRVGETADLAPSPRTRRRPASDLFDAILAASRKDPTVKTSVFRDRRAAPFTAPQLGVWKWRAMLRARSPGAALRRHRAPRRAALRLRVSCWSTAGLSPSPRW
jgi:hypothetical protein